MCFDCRFGKQDSRAETIFRGGWREAKAILDCKTIIKMIKLKVVNSKFLAKSLANF